MAEYRVSIAFFRYFSNKKLILAKYWFYIEMYKCNTNISEILELH